MDEIVGIKILIIGLAALMGALMLVKATVKRYTTRRARKHRRNRKRASQILKKLQTMQEPQMFHYLRKIDPFVFEELILSAYSRSGKRVRRNRAYTGDGGVDGQVKINGHWHLIQAKRYGQTINPQHMIEFSELCARHNRKGLFVHTGRIGQKSRSGAGPSVEIISGQKLIELLRFSRERSQ